MQLKCAMFHTFLLSFEGVVASLISGKFRCQKKPSLNCPASQVQTPQPVTLSCDKKPNREKKEGRYKGTYSRDRCISNITLGFERGAIIR